MITKSKALLGLLCCAWGWWATPVLQAQVWTAGTGTEGLNLQAILSSGDLVLTGGATGTYRSEDGGDSYDEANQGNTSVGPTRGFAQDDDFFYQCTSNGVFRTDDGGATWNAVSAGLPQLLCHGMVQAEGRLWVVTPTGVFTSVDQGVQWAAAGLEGLDVRCIAIQDGVLHVGTQGDGLFRSTDDGDSWEPTSGGLASTNFRAIEAHAGALFAGGQVGTGVYRSTDGGDSWELLANGIPMGSYRGFASEGTWIAAGSFGGGVHVSSDGGDSWTVINEGLGDLTVFDLDFSATHLHAATNEAGAWRLPIAALGPTSGGEAPPAIQGGAMWPHPCDTRLNVDAPVGTGFTAWNAQGQRLRAGVLDGRPIDTSEWPTGWVYMRLDGVPGARAIMVIHP